MMVNRLEAVRDPNRLGVLRSAGLLDTPPEDAYDRLTRLATAALQTPIALFSLVDAERLFVKSHHGLPDPWASRREFPLTHSYCWLVVATGEPLAVADARQHPLLAESPAIHELGMVSYLGLPITGEGELVIGTIAAIDHQPRRWSDEDVRTLEDLATLVVAEIGRSAAAPADRHGTVAESGARTALLEALGDGVCEIDRAGVCTFINQTGAAMLGYQPEELPGRRLLDLIHHSRADGSPWHAHESPLQRSLATGERCQVEDGVLWRRDLSSFTARYTAFPSSAGSATGSTIVIFADVTARQQAAAERDRLLAREQTMRREAEEDHRRSTFLARASALFGGSLDEAATLTNVARLLVPFFADWCAIDLIDETGEIRRVATVHRDPTKANLPRELAERYPADPGTRHGGRKVIETGESELIAEVSDRDLLAVAREAEHLRGLREVGCQSYLCVPLTAGGRILGALTLVYGDSDRRYRTADAFFAEDLGRRAATALANARLFGDTQSAIGIRNDVLVSVSHDLRNPLANIKGFAQLVLRGVRQLGTPEAEEMATWLARIDATTTRMTSQIDELLDLGRLQTGRPLDLDRQPTNIVSLARQIAEVHRQTDEQRQILVNAAVSNLTGSWDARRIERLLANLISNAVTYSPNGGDVIISINAADLDGRPGAVIAVRDTGIGIPAADLPHIFERYYRGRNVAVGSSGAGIGLASVQQIVAQHGGVIDVASAEGAGTTVTIRLPL